MSLMSTKAAMFLLAAAAAAITGLSFAMLVPMVNSQQDCEAAGVSCTVEELRNYCRDAYAGNSAGWYACMNQVPTPNPGD